MITIKNKYLQGYKFIDLFAGLGGFRLALESLGAECVYSDEWNEPVCQVYYKNFGEIPAGDITKIDEKTIPEHDIIHFLRREMLDFTAFPVFFVSNLLLVQRKKYYFNRATVSRNCSIVL